MIIRRIYLPLERWIHLGYVPVHPDHIRHHNHDRDPEHSLFSQMFHLWSIFVPVRIFHDLTVIIVIVVNVS